MTRKLLTAAAIALLVGGAPLGLSDAAFAKGTTHSTHASTSHGGSSHSTAGHGGSSHSASSQAHGGGGKSADSAGGRSSGGGGGGGAGFGGGDMARTILGMVGGLLGQR